MPVDLSNIYMLFIRQQDNATVHSSIKQNEKEKKIMKIEIEDARTMEEKKRNKNRSIRSGTL